MSPASIVVRPGARWRLAARVGLVLTLAFVAAMTLVPDPRGDIVLEVHGGFFSGDLGLQDFTANAVLFFPLGALLVASGLRAPWAVVTVFLTSLAIETLQFVAIPGRDASNADLLANSLGGLAGVALAANFGALWRPSAALAGMLAAASGALGVLVLAATAWLCQPAGPGAVYHGQWSGGAWPGAEPSAFGILRARANDVEVPWGAIPGSAQLAQRAREGRLHVELRGIPGARPAADERILGLFESAPQWGSELLVIERWGDDLVFVPRARAERWLLRSPWVRLRGAMEGLAGDTVELSAEIGRGWRRITVRSRRGDRAAALPVAVTGWMLFVPKSVTPARGTWGLTFLWLVILLGPSLFWAWRRRGARQTTGSAPNGRQTASA